MSRPTTTTQRPRTWRVVLVAHAAVVAVLLVLFAILTTTHPGPDANIGAGIVGLALLVLGLPWSIPALVSSYDPDGSAALQYLVRLGPAVLNVVLHAAVHVIAARRKRP